MENRFINNQKSLSEISRELDATTNQVTEAVSQAAGVNQKPDSTEINRLYRNDPLAKDLIEKIVETGGLPAEKLGLKKNERALSLESDNEDTWEDALYSICGC